jgi:hypothetical protein
MGAPELALDGLAADLHSCGVRLKTEGVPV